MGVVRLSTHTKTNLFSIFLKRRRLVFALIQWFATIEHSIDENPEGEHVRGEGAGVCEGVLWSPVVEMGLPTRGHVYLPTSACKQRLKHATSIDKYINLTIHLNMNRFNHKHCHVFYC